MRCGRAEIIVAVAFIDQLTSFVGVAVGRRGAAARVDFTPARSSRTRPGSGLQTTCWTVRECRLHRYAIPECDPNPASKERFVKL
jgi:hypothetical protein